MRPAVARVWALSTLCLCATCARPRTAIVFMVHTTMHVGDFADAPSNASPRRVTGFTSQLRWGPTRPPQEVALRESEVVRVAAAPRADASPREVRLPYPIYYVQAPDPGEERYARVTLTEVSVLDRDGRAVSLPTAPAGQGRFVEGVTYTIDIDIDDACVGRQCAEGETCGFGGRCVPIDRPAPGVGTEDQGVRPGAPSPVPCPDGGAGCFESPLRDAGADAGDAASGPDVADASVTGDATMDVRTTPSCPACAFVGDPACAACAGDGGAPRDAATDTNDGALPCFPTIEPPTPAPRHPGGLCADLRGAYTKRSVNVGYYRYTLTNDTEFVFDVRGREPHTIRRVPGGTPIALASSGEHNYDPTACQSPPNSGEVPVCCSAASDGYCRNAASSCRSNSPPLQRGVALPDGFSDITTAHYAYWGYVPGDGRLGWFLLREGGAVYGHPRASRPAELRGISGNEFEAALELTGCDAAGVPRPTRTCAMVNPCDEGVRDCTGCDPGGAERRCERRADQTDPMRYLRPIRPPSGQPASGWGVYLRWAPQSSPRQWLRWGDAVRVYYRSKDAAGHPWAFVEVVTAPGSALTPAAPPHALDGCTPQRWACEPCSSGGTCGWVDGDFLDTSVFDGTSGC